MASPEWIGSERDQLASSSRSENARRLTALFALSFAVSAATAVLWTAFAERQVMDGAADRHAKIHLAYLQAVERARGTASQGGVAVGGKSPYWGALRDVQSQFPHLKLGIVLREKNPSADVFKVLGGGPAGSSFTNERDGWAKTHYVLATGNFAILQVASFVRVELEAWRRLAAAGAACLFCAFFSFGLFWMRRSAVNGGDQIGAKILAVNAVFAEIASVIARLQTAVEVASRAKAGEDLEEILSRIRMVSVNGSIEAARSHEAFRVFHVMMQEINHLATQAGELAKTVDIAPVREDLQRIDAVLKAAVAPAPAGERDSDLFGAKLRAR